MGCNSSIKPITTNVISTKATLSEIKTTNIISKPEAIIKTYQNLWQEIADHSTLGIGYFDKYEKQVNHYSKHKLHLNWISKRAEPYLYFILQEIKKRKMPYEIALLPVIESGYRPIASSQVKATGLWQIMPNTGKMLGLKRSWWYEGRQDIYKSTHAALDYLQKLYQKNDQDWLLAFASYNSGYGNILKARKKYLKNNPDGYVDYWSIQKYLPKETQNYIPRLLAVSYLVENHQAHKIKLKPISNKPHFVKIKLKQQVDIHKIALATQHDLENIKNLNTGLLRAATPPEENYYLLLPVKSAKYFHQTIAESPDFFRVNWQNHKVKSGESLSVISEKYNTSTQEIKKLNRLKSNRIRIGKQLLIPVRQKNKTAYKIGYLKND